MSDGRPFPTPRQPARQPANVPPHPLRDDDVIENKRLRGMVVRAGAGAVPAVWED